MVLQGVILCPDEALRDVFGVVVEDRGMCLLKVHHHDLLKYNCSESLWHPLKEELLSQTVVDILPGQMDLSYN
jgi:hypothetical protein